MLCLERKSKHVNEQQSGVFLSCRGVTIGVSVERVTMNGKVILGFSAPREVEILRAELVGADGRHAETGAKL